MSTEHSEELARRAARHGALSDPARLAIVDLLSLGDASPKLLQDRLQMPSNLMAHHLKVLEGVGLLTRRRSDADRRRTYVQLVPSALDGIGIGAARPAHRLVFVCTANSARSQLAAALWKHSSPVPAVSAGTHPAPRVDPGAIAVAGRHGIRISSIRPRALADVLLDGDVIVTVCDNAHEELHADESLHWSVADPVRQGTDAAFEAAFTEITRRVADVAPRIRAS